MLGGRQLEHEEPLSYGRASVDMVIQVLESLVQQLRDGRRVFVHCISGESRSPVRSRPKE